MFDKMLFPEHRKTTNIHAPSTQVTQPLSNASGSVIPTPSRKITVGEPFAVRLVPRKRKQGESSMESSLNMREELKISREDVEKYFDMPQPDAAVALVSSSFSSLQILIFNSGNILIYIEECLQKDWCVPLALPAPVRWNQAKNFKSLVGSRGMDGGSTGTCRGSESLQ